MSGLHDGAEGVQAAGVQAEAVGDEAAAAAGRPAHEQQADLLVGNIHGRQGV